VQGVIMQPAVTQQLDDVSPREYDKFFLPDAPPSEAGRRPTISKHLRKLAAGQHRLFAGRSSLAPVGTGARTTARGDRSSSEG
jgi:hypothetical protein